MLKAKLFCPPIRQRQILSRICVDIRVPPKLYLGAGGGASYGDEEKLKSWGSMPYPQTWEINLNNFNTPCI